MACRVHDRSAEDLQLLAKTAARKVSRMNGERTKAQLQDEDILERIEGLVPFAELVTQHLTQQQQAGAEGETRGGKKKPKSRSERLAPVRALQEQYKQVLWLQPGKASPVLSTSSWSKLQRS